MNQPKLIKYLVLGLPLGLFFLGGASMIWHFKHPHESEKKPKNEAKSKPVAKEDLEFNVKRLATELGSRPVSDALKTRQTASFIEGSLGMNNIGYPMVTRVNFPWQGRDVTNLSVEVKGARSPEEIILVVAHYDSALGAAGANSNGTGVAANLSLANLFLRTNNLRTVQFHFLANGLGPAPTGAEVLAQKFKALGSNIVATFVLDELGGLGAATTPLNDVVWSATESSKDLLTLCQTKFAENTTLLSSAQTVTFTNCATAQAFVEAGLPVMRVSSGMKALDEPKAINFATLTDLVRSLGRTLQALANE